MCSFEGLHTRFMSAGRCTDKHLIKEKRCKIHLLYLQPWLLVKETVSQPRAAKADWTLEVTELCIYTNKNGRCYCLKWFSALKVWQLPNFCGGPCQTFVVAHAKLLFHKTRYPESAKILAIAKLMWKIPNNFHKHFLCFSQNI